MVANPVHSQPCPSDVSAQQGLTHLRHEILDPDQAEGSAGLEPSAYETHSTRRAKVAPIYKKTGNLRAVQLLLGHTKMDNTARYLGVDRDDALTLSEGIDL